MYYKERLESVRRGLADLLKDMEDEWECMPDGSLLVYEKRGKRYYCQRFPKGGNQKKEHRVAISDNADLVLALVRKQYLGKAIELARKDLNVIDKAVSGYSPVSEESVMEKFFAKYPELSSGAFYGKGDPAAWASTYKPEEGFYAEGLKSVSSKGDKMRSGGEMYISSRLDHFGIPYRYEASLNIPDLSYKPDFTIMRPRDREIIYWEHFGKVNDMDYIRNNIVKVRDYIDYGIMPWKNLIMTYNNEQGGFDGKIIDAMIECWLL